jgi:hypothetical protein
MYACAVCAVGRLNRLDCLLASLRDAALSESIPVVSLALNR